MPETDELAVEPAALRGRVREKYRIVATAPASRPHFHTGRPPTARFGYDTPIVDCLPNRAVESFAGVADPLTLRVLEEGERVVELGWGAGIARPRHRHRELPHLGTSGSPCGALAVHQDRVGVVATTNPRRHPC
jgi:hypothetical protein